MLLYTSPECILRQHSTDGENTRDFLQYRWERTLTETSAHRKCVEKSFARDQWALLSYIWPIMQHSLVTQESSKCMIFNDVNSIGQICRRLCIVQSTTVKITPNGDHVSARTLATAFFTKQPAWIYQNWHPWSTSPNQVRQRIFRSNWWLVQ